MATNREKYINNASIEELYNLLDWKKIEDKFGFKAKGTNDIYKWFLQEAEEEKTCGRDYHTQKKK